MPLIWPSTWPLGLLLAGGAAAALFAAHRLRSSPPQRPAATLLFWRQAAPLVRATTLWGRFRHARTFALLLAIALAMAWPLVAPHAGGNAYVAVLDAGYTTQEPGDDGRPAFDTLRERLLAECPDHTPVVLADAAPRVLADADTPAAVVQHRLSAARPTNQAAATSAAMQLAAQLRPDASRIAWFTDAAAVPPALPGAVAAKVELHALPRAHPLPRIVTVTFDSGRLRVRVAGADATCTLVATPAGGTPRRIAVTNNDVTIDEVPGDGRHWLLLIERGNRAGHAVAVQAPVTAGVGFVFTGEIPSAIRAALLALGRDSSGPSAVAVSAVPTDAARAIRLTDAPSLPAAVDGIPVRPLAWDGGAVVAGRVDAPSQKTLWLSATLWAGDRPRRATFPLLLRKLALDLAGVEDPPPAVAAARATIDPVWTNASFSAVDDPPAAAAAPAEFHRAFRVDVSTWVLTAALALLGVESWLHYRRAIP